MTAFYFTPPYLYRLIDYCVSKIRLLQINGIKPYLVFDGARLDMKSRVEGERSQLRTQALLKTHSLIQAGDLNGANKKFLQAIEISSDIIEELIKVLRKLKVDFVVAPYEADAQLVYLYRHKIVDFIITEDSDLLMFGAGNILFKMGTKGRGFSIDLSELHLCDAFKCLEKHAGKSKEERSVIYQQFLLRASFLSGCDYLPGLKGIGLKSAIKLVQTFGENLFGAISEGSLKNNFDVQKYYESCQKAEMTFKHQIVFDPIAKKETNLVPLEESEVKFEDIKFLGQRRED